MDKVNEDKVTENKKARVKKVRHTYKAFKEQLSTAYYRADIAGPQFKRIDDAIQRMKRAADQKWYKVND